MPTLRFYVNVLIKQHEGLRTVNRPETTRLGPCMERVTLTQKEECT